MRYDSSKQEEFIVTDLVVRGVQNDEELRLAHDLMARGHAADSFDAMHWMETTGVGYPGFRPEHTRIALWRGELAGAARLTTDTIRIGEARLKMGGLGWVTTDGRHRHKGVGRELISETLRLMHTQNYHVSMLFGIPNFYHRYGFATSLAEYASTIALDEALVTPAPVYRMRPGKPGDIRAMQKLHDAGESEIACSLVRSAAHVTNKWHRWRNLRVLTDEQGRVMAYLLPKRVDHVLTIEECGAASPAWCNGVLHAAGEIAQEEYVAEIRFDGPPTHPVIQCLHRYRSTHEMRLVRDEGGMLAFVQVGETLESMIPEWESRLQRSALREARVEFTLLIERASFRLRMRHGALDIASGSGPNKFSVSTAEALHLLTGYRYFEEILNSRRRMLSPEARTALEIMFPKRTPYVWSVDRL
jgi:predicted acetyltransferase